MRNVHCVSQIYNKLKAKVDKTLNLSQRIWYK